MFNGNTAAMAASYGVAPRTVNRWMTGERTPQGANAEQLHRDATAVQTTERGRKRRAKELKARGGASSGHRAHVGRAGTFTIRGSDAVRQRDIDLDLTGEEAAALAVAEDDEEVRGIIGDAIARYFNGGGVYGGFHGEDFDFDADTFHLS
jgi:hypothetical protein